MEPGEIFGVPITVNTESTLKRTAEWSFTWNRLDSTATTISVQMEGDGSSPMSLNAALDGDSQGTKYLVNMTSSHWTPLVLSSSKSNNISTNIATDWLFQSLPEIGCLTLQDLILPGSHDAGMSTIGYHTAGITASNTQTQTLNILDQLTSGIRYFDIRPVISHGKFYTGHYSVELDIGLGADGQSITDIISEINTFTSSYNELIILELSHTMDTENDYTPFTTAQWSTLLTLFNTTLNHLYPLPTPLAANNTLLTQIPLSTFISTAPAVLMITDSLPSTTLSSLNLLNAGFYSQSQFPTYNNYSDTTDLKTMRSDQYAKYISQSASPDTPDQLFILSWTATLDVADDVGLGPSILDLAGESDGMLFQSGGNVPQTGVVEWVDSTRVPNVVLIDGVTADVGVGLVSWALGVARFYHSC